MTSSRWYIVAAAAAVVLAGTLYSIARCRRNSADAELTNQLLEEPEGVAAAAAGGGADAAPPTRGDADSTVWLAPDTEVEQFEPSMRAALASYGAEMPSATGDQVSPSEGDAWLAPVSNIS